MKRKILILLTIICSFSTLFLFSCGKKKEPPKEPVYYYVTFDADNGTTSNMVPVESGKVVSKPTDPVKDKFTFLYWTLDGVEFDFETKIEKHLTLIAKYSANEVKTTRIIWTEDEAAQYVFEGSVPRTVEVGTTVKFNVKTSPYYEGTLKVLVNGKEITKSADNSYSFVTEDITSTTVTTEGLIIQDDEVKGRGTEDNPYVISNASQFKTFTEGVNSTTNTKYNEAYFVLESDLDFNGYEIDIIGDTLNSNEFSGHFDGKNHTISNFTLKGKNGLFGLFGYLVIAEIKNLKIESDLSYVPVSKYINLVGSLAAYNIASDIMNCHFSGSIMVDNNLTVSEEVYVGGLVGYMQSYSNTYTSTLSYSTVSANITTSGNTEVASAGGIAGVLLGTDVSTPAYIYNSAFNGKVIGKSLVSGGIVGTLSKNASIANCYSTGEVNASSETKSTVAGGIVGTAENETVVDSSFSTSTITSTNTTPGTIIGNAHISGTSGIDDQKVLEIENYHSTTKKITKDGTTYDLEKFEDVIKLLNWNRDDWNTDLTPNFETAEKQEFIVSFNFGRFVTNEGLDGNELSLDLDEVKITGYLPIYWVYGGSGMNNFMADDQTISYGYFLDEARTIRVPSSYLLTKETTIYVGFADYSEIKGEYYVHLKNNEIKLVFDERGKMTMYYEGSVSNYMYVFDGNKILIKEAYFAHIEYPSLEDSYDLDIDYYAKVQDDTLLIYDTEFFSLENDMEIIAHKRTAAMGKWYTADNKEYIFLSDGTGSISDGSTFKYECNGKNVTITIGNNTINATISADGTLMAAETGEMLSITRYDEFMGTWEAEFANPDEISFDGKGQVTYQKNVYNYTIDENGVLNFGEYHASFNEQGLLVLDHNGKTKVFGRSGSYIGTWTDTLLDYWVSFGGITKEGYGEGYDSYGVNFTYIQKEDEDGLSFITMYYGTQMYGYGNLAKGSNDPESPIDPDTVMLYLGVYTPSNGMIVDDYNVCYVDSFFGDWNGENGLSLSFNGLGDYDIYIYLNTMQEYWDVRGFVTITENGTSSEVRYNFDRNTSTGSFVYRDQTYNITVEAGNLVINGITYKHPDSLSEYEYQTGDMILIFNGKSNVNLGVVTITTPSGETEYSYIINGENAEIYDNTTLVYTLRMGEKFELIPATGEASELGLYHKLMGNIYAVSSTSQLEFTNVFDINGIAKAYLVTADERTELNVLYMDKNYVALYLDQTFLYYVYYLDTDCAALCNSLFTPVSVIAKADELRGIWTTATGETITFDGLSKAAAYTDPSCKVLEKDETGTYLEQYSYEKHQDYYVIIATENNEIVEKYYVYTEYVENAIEYKKGDQTIYVVIAE